MDYKQFNDKFPLFEVEGNFENKLTMSITEKVPTEKEIEDFHDKLDTLVHDTFGKSPEEKKCEDKKNVVSFKPKSKNKNVELNPKMEDNGTT